MIREKTRATIAPKGGWWESYTLTKERREISYIRIPSGQRNLFDGSSSIQEQLYRLFDTQGCQIFFDGGACHIPEKTTGMAFAQVDLSSQVANGKLAAIVIAQVS